MKSSEYDYYVRCFINGSKSFMDILSCIDYEHGSEVAERCVSQMQRKIKSAMNKAGRGHEFMNFEMN